MIKHITPIMKRQGHGVIINIASAAGHRGLSNHSIYSATKREG
jgi:short-subunit dehydrogenase